MTKAKKIYILYIVNSKKSLATAQSFARYFNPPAGISSALLEEINLTEEEQSYHYFLDICLGWKEGIQRLIANNFDCLQSPKYHTLFFEIDSLVNDDSKPEYLKYLERLQEIGAYHRLDLSRGYLACTSLKLSEASKEILYTYDVRPPILRKPFTIEQLENLFSNFRASLGSDYFLLETNEVRDGQGELTQIRRSLRYYDPNGKLRGWSIPSLYKVPKTQLVLPKYLINTPHWNNHQTQSGADEED
jgi:hypothetical protein